MKNKSLAILLLATLALVAGSAYAGASMKMASEMQEPPADPKKKKPGEECKASDECQNHHSCVKTGEKGICTAPPRPKIPPGAVT